MNRMLQRLTGKKNVFFSVNSRFKMRLKSQQTSVYLNLLQLKGQIRAFNQFGVLFSAAGKNKGRSICFAVQADRAKFRVKKVYENKWKMTDRKVEPKVLVVMS